MPNRHTLIGMTVTVLMMGGALTAVAQGPRIYFGLPHTTVGNVHVSPSQDDTLMLELGDGSPAQNHLMIDPSNGEVMALAGLGMALELRPVYWPETQSLLVGSGAVMPVNGVPEASDLILAISRSGEQTQLSILRAAPNGLRSVPIRSYEDKIYDAIFIYQPPEALFPRDGSGKPGAMIVSGPVLYTRDGAFYIDTDGMMKIAAGSGKAGTLDNPIYGLVFSQPQYVGFPGQPPVLVSGIAFYNTDNPAPAPSFPLYLSSWGQGPLAVAIEDEYLIYQGIPVRTGLLASIQDEAKGFSSLIRREIPGSGGVTLEYHPGMTANIEEWLSGGMLPEVFSIADGLKVESKKRINVETTLSQARYVMNIMPDFSRVTDFSQTLDLLFVSELRSQDGLGYRTDIDAIYLKNLAITVTQTERYESFQLRYIPAGWTLAPGDVQLDGYTIPTSPTSASLTIKTKSSPPKSGEPNPWSLGITMIQLPPRDKDKPFRYLKFSQPVEVTVEGSPEVYEGTTLTMRGIEKKDIRRGMVIAKPGYITPAGKALSDPTVLISLQLIGSPSSPTGPEVVYTTKGGFFEPGQSVCLQIPGDLDQWLLQGASFQWYKDQQLLPGETGATLCFSSLTEADSGTYRVVADSPDGSKSQVQYSFYLQVASNVPAAGTIGIIAASVVLALVGMYGIQRRIRRA